jgi:hypothetical protein
LDPIYPQGATGETMTNRLIILRIGRTTKHDYTRLGEVSGGNREVPDTVTLLAEQIMQDDAEDVVRAVLSAAKGGDMVAARLVLERILPARRGRPVVFALPTVQTPADLPLVLGCRRSWHRDTRGRSGGGGRVGCATARGQTCGSRASGSKNWKL